MLPRLSSILSAVLILLAFGGCATSDPSGGGSSGPPSSSSGGTSVPAPAPAPQSAPLPIPLPAPATSGTPAGSSDPQSSSSAPTSSTSTAGSGSSGTAQTPDERRAAIDRRLNDSLGTFDEELRKEQERVAQERDAREASGAATGTETDGDEAAKEGEGEPGTAETESPTVASTDGKQADDGTARPGDLKSDKDRAGGQNSGAASGTGGTAQNIPDGSDDDIVARRLRKAAEQETDPELKDKLWKEYIEYKKNAGQ
jgi:hypothetical protein